MRAFITSQAAIAAIAGTLLSAPHLARAQGDTRGTSSQETTVEVQNNRKVPVTVFIDRGPFDVRVGEVGPMKTATLKLPTWVASEGHDVQIFVHPEGEEDLASQEFSVHRGVHLGVLVPEGNGAWPSSEPAAARMSAVLTPDQLSATTLTVENTYPVRVVMYVEQGPFDVRLGTVGATSTATLTLPSWVVNDHESIQIFAHPERGQDLESTRLDLRKGEHLGLRLSNR